MIIEIERVLLRIVDDFERGNLIISRIFESIQCQMRFLIQFLDLSKVGYPASVFTRRVQISP